MGAVLLLQADDIATFTSYVERNLSVDTRYRVIWDVATESISNNYTCSITEENYAICISNPELIEQLMAQRPPKNKDETFVLQIYEAFRNGEPNGVIKAYLLPWQRNLNFSYCLQRPDHARHDDEYDNMIDEGLDVFVSHSICCNFRIRVRIYLL